MSVQNVDLDISHYDLQDILNLFQLDHDFGATEMKKAKQVVLRLHPDKSRLDAKYFLFYSKAYKILHSMYEFNNRSSTRNKQINTEEYLPGDTNEEEKKAALNVFFGKNKHLQKDSGHFNKWFNEEFEKQKTQNEESDSGYGDWLLSDEGVHDSGGATSLSAMTEAIQKKKKEVRDMIVHQGVQENDASNAFGGMSLGTDFAGNYSSGLFSDGVAFQDLRQAHEESVIPVTDEDYANVPKFRSVNEYHTFRSQQDTTPLSEQQALTYLQQREREEESMSTQRAYKLARETEEAQGKNREFWAGMLKIEDNPRK